MLYVEKGPGVALCFNPQLHQRRFFIGREKPGEQSEVAQLIQQTLEQERWQREMMEQRYNQYMDEQEVSPPLVPGWTGREVA